MRLLSAVIKIVYLSPRSSVGLYLRYYPPSCATKYRRQFDGNAPSVSISMQQNGIEFNDSERRQKGGGGGGGGGGGRGRGVFRGVPRD